MFKVKDSQKALRQSLQDEFDRALESSPSDDNRGESSASSLESIVEELSNLSDDVAYRDHPVEKLRQHLPSRFYTLVDTGVGSLFQVHSVECGLSGAVWKRPFSRERKSLGALVENEQVVITRTTNDPEQFGHLKRLGEHLAGALNIEFRNLEALRTPPPLDWADVEGRLGSLLKLLTGASVLLCLCSFGSIAALAALPFLAGALVQLRKLRVTPVTFTAESTRLVELGHVGWALNLLMLGGFVVPAVLVATFLLVQNQLMADGFRSEFGESISIMSIVLMAVVVLWIVISVYRIRKDITSAMVG